MAGHDRRRYQPRGEPLPGRAGVELTAKSDCTAYDCEFVALAHELRRPLVTLDGDVLAAFPKTACSPRAFLAR